jgi:hypothetical protein
MRAWILAVLISIFISGCTTLGTNKVSLATDEGQKVEKTIEPIGFIGIELTDRVRSGQYQAYLATFPPELFTEFHPLRVRYPALAYGVHTGKEYPAQALYVGYADCALRVVFIVEGNPGEPVVGALATTRFTKVFSLYGDAISVKTPEKLISDAKYRQEVVLGGGTAVKRLKSVPLSGPNGLQRIFASWGTARVPGLLDQATPLSEKFVRLVARENPELSFQEKLVGNGQFGLSLSWFSIAMGAAQDVLIAAGATDKGVDEQSELRRGYQGMIAQVVAAQYQSALDAGMACRGRPTVTVKK